MTNDDTFVKITNKDIYNELQEQRKIKEEILKQAKLTNGRVTKLEKNSWGNWASQHPIYFGLLVAVILILFISDFRHPVMGFLLNFL